MSNQSHISQKRLNDFDDALNFLSAEARSSIVDGIKQVMNIGTNSSSSLSMKRYHVIMTHISSIVPAESVDQIRTEFHRCMKFNPDVPYAKRNEAQKERYARLKADGMSTYIITGQRDLYYRRKALAEAASKLI